MKYQSKNYKETINIAKQYAKTLSAGDVVLLCGDLGAGKTVFTKGIVEQLGGNAENVVSPTFTIVNEYNTTPQVYHFDFYRIKSQEELFAIGIEEYLYGGGICVIEWPERAPDILADISCKKVTITKNNEERIINF